MITLIQYQIAFEIAVVAYVVCCIMTRQNYILSWYDDALTQVELYIGKWLSYPLGKCEKCFGGQIAFWYWLLEFQTYHLEIWYNAFLSHMIFVCTTILTITIIKSLIRKWK